MRILSPGSRFEIKGVAFEVKKSQGALITAEGKNKDGKIVVFKLGDEFSVYDTMYSVQHERIRKGAIILKALAIGKRKK